MRDDFYVTIEIRGSRPLGVWVGCQTNFSERLGSLERMRGESSFHGASHLKKSRAWAKWKEENHEVVSLPSMQCGPHTALHL